MLWMLAKIVNIVPRAGIKLTSLAIHPSVLPLHDIGPVMSPICTCLPVYAAPCLRRPVQTTTVIIYEELFSKTRYSIINAEPQVRQRQISILYVIGLTRLGSKLLTSHTGGMYSTECAAAPILKKRKRHVFKTQLLLSHLQITQTHTSPVETSRNNPRPYTPLTRSMPQRHSGN